jgi:hypothetical protein
LKNGKKRVRILLGSHADKPSFDIMVMRHGTQKDFVVNALFKKSTGSALAGADVKALGGRIPMLEIARDLDAITYDYYRSAWDDWHKATASEQLPL